MKQELETFMENFYSTKVNAQGDVLVYKTRRGFAKSLAEEANKLIEALGLSLVAIPSSLSSADSFYVQSNEVEL